MSRDRGQGTLLQAWPLLAAAALLLAIAWVPTERWITLGLAVTGRGALEAVTREALEELPWVLRALAALAVAWAAFGRLDRREARPRPQAPAVPPRLHWIVPLVTLALVVTCVRSFVLRDGMISGDEWNNYFSAELFSQGRIFDSPPPEPEFFRFTYFVTHGDRYFSIFPPLWPAILAIGMKLGIAVWINLVLAIAGVVLAARWDRERGPWIAWLLVLSPMFVFTAASYFASMTVLALVLAELWALRCWSLAPHGSRGVGARWALLSGLTWGALFAAHYPTAIGAGIPPLLLCFWQARRRRGAAMHIVFAIGGASLVLIALGAYHRALHGGAPWLFPAALYEHDLLRIRPSFGWIARGLAYSALHAVRLLAWTLPLLPLLALLGARRRSAHDGLLIAAAVGLVAVYFFFPSAGGPQYGPRYYFGLLGPLAILGARAMEALGGTSGGRAFRAALLVAAIVLFSARLPIEARRAAGVNAPFRLAADAHLEQAVVFLRNVNRADTGRNAPGWKGSVWFVQDLGDRDSTLLARYPGRTAWVYSRAGGQPHLGRIPATSATPAPPGTP